MSLTDKYTDIATALRKQYGTNDKYHLADMPTLIDNLEVKNLLEAGQTFDSTVNKIGYDLPLKGATIDDWNSVAGKTVTISFDVTWTGYTYTPGGSRNRIGFEHHLVNETGLEQYVGAWLTPDSESGTKHITETYRVISGKITKVDEGSFYTQINCSSIKGTNLKIVENPMGGIEPPSLIIGWPNYVSLNLATKASMVTPFQIASAPLVQGKYRFDFAIKGTNTTTACIALFNFSEDGHASNVFPWCQNFAVSSQYEDKSFTITVPEDKKHRLIVFASGYNQGTGKEMVFLKDVHLTKIN